MKPLGLYDSNLQMFVEKPRDADVHRLRFLRWLAEHGKLEHAIAGPPRGTYSAAISGGAAEMLPPAA